MTDPSAPDAGTRIPDNIYATAVDDRPPLSPAEQRQWAIVTHVLGLFTQVVGAAVMFFLFRSRGEFVRAHVTTAMNFQITILILSFVAVGISFFSVFLSVASSSGSAAPPSVGVFFIGWFGMLGLSLLNFALSILGAVRASRGALYRYPIAIPFFKA